MTDAAATAILLGAAIAIFTFGMLVGGVIVWAAMTYWRKK